MQADESGDEAAAVPLCSDACDSLLDLRYYYEPVRAGTDAGDDVHPWVFFLQWYRGKLYHLHHSADPFANPEMYNATAPRLKTEKYEITFYRLGDPVNATMSYYGSEPYVLCYDCVNTTFECINLYSDDVAARDREMQRLKAWVVETNIKPKLPHASIQTLADIATYEYTDEAPHMWALFLQYFIGAGFDVATSTRAIRPLERLFSTGVIHGTGYTLRFDEETKQAFLNSKPYDIYGANGFAALDTLKRRVCILECPP